MFEVFKGTTLVTSCISKFCADTCTLGVPNFYSFMQTETECLSRFSKRLVPRTIKNMERVYSFIVLFSLKSNSYFDTFIFSISILKFICFST